MKEFEKKWLLETTATIANAITLLRALNDGTQLEQLKTLGFVHGNYPLGIISVDQTGCGKATKPKAIRLYLFPCYAERVLYFMLIADKKSQSEDVKLCKEFVSKKIEAIELQKLKTQ